MPKTWWGGKGSPAVAACEPQYTFPVVLATVFLLIVWLAFGTGAHLNPSITVGAVAAGMLPLAHGLVRVAAQVGQWNREHTNLNHDLSGLPFILNCSPGRSVEWRSR